MSRVKNLQGHVDTRLLTFYTRVLKTLVTLPATFIIAAIMLTFAASIELEPQSAFLAWVQRNIDWLTPPVWKVALWGCGTLLLMLHKKPIGVWLFVIASPLLIMLAFYFTGISSSILPNEQFSYIVLAWLFIITTLYMLHTVYTDAQAEGIEHLRLLNETLMMENESLKAQLSTSQAALPEAKGGEEHEQ